MTVPSVLVPWSNIKSAIGYVPPALRSQVFRELLGDDWPLAEQLSVAPAPVAPAPVAPAPVAPASVVKPRSFPLSLDQGRKLMRSRLHSQTVHLLGALVDNEGPDGVATLTMSEITRLTGAGEWKNFAQGRLGGLHIALRHISGVPPRADLLWWKKVGEVDTVNVDGPAVATLRAVLAESLL